MVYNYVPKGICAHAIRVELDDARIIRKVDILGGCDGNHQGISALVEGMPAEEAIRRMRGIRCGFKSTSCPDQLAIALEQALKQSAAN